MGEHRPHTHDGSLRNMEQPVAIDSNYTGHIAPGSSAQRRTVDGASIIKISVGPMDNNAYLVQCSSTGLSLLIDAANEAPRLIQLVRAEAGGVLELIVTTHSHPDHWLALQDVVSAIGASTAAHPLDAEPLPVPPDFDLDDGESIQIGELELEIIHLSGHTPGSVALALTEPGGRVHLFTGDSLFPGGVGKTADAERFASLMADVETKLFGRFGDDTIVYPGHGDDTTLGNERPHLAEWRERGW